MKIADGIRKYGFSAWHERMLLIGHGWLVVSIVSAVFAFGALEALLQGGEWLALVSDALVAAVLGMVAILSLHRFLHHLARAQKIGSQATCPKCQTFGQLQVVTEDRAHRWVRVCCRKCGHEWVIDDG
jgi:membrane protein implicated in regulation of membrane protease activity